MLAKQYADALSDRLPPNLFRPVPSRALWLPVHSLIVAACTLAIVDGHLGVVAKCGLAIIIGVSLAAQDASVVKRISLEVRTKMQRAVDDMLRRRRSIFFGSVFDSEEG